MNKNIKKIREFFDYSSVIRWGILTGVISLFTVFLYPNLIVQRYFYKVGDIAEKDVKAPRDFFVEDKTATDIKRQEVYEESLTIYDYDGKLLSQLTSQIDESFAEMREIFESEKNINRVDSSLRLEPTEGLRLEPTTGLPKHEPNTYTFPPPAASSSAVEAATVEKSLHDRIWEMKPEFEKKLGISVHDESFKLLEKEEFSKNIADAVSSIVTQILENGVVSNKDVLLREDGKGIILRTLESRTETTVQNLKKFYGPDQYKDMVSIIGKPMLKDMRPAIVLLIVDFARRIIQPNITLNKSETEKRKKLSATNIEPVPYKIKQGEMLLREGERVTQEQLQIIQILNKQNKIEKKYIKTAWRCRNYPVASSDYLFSPYLSYKSCSGEQYKQRCSFSCCYPDIILYAP